MAADCSGRQGWQGQSRTGMKGFSFALHHEDGSARQASLSTPHGVVETPAFMPVGTHGSVRGLSMDEIGGAGARMILANAYHLFLRPGDEMVRALGGIHAFSRWNGPLLTDSGGYQVFSLSRYRSVSEEGVVFRSRIDGQRHSYTPERVMQIERNIGADVIMQLDELIEAGADTARARAAMERSLRWLERCSVEFERLEREGRAPLSSDHATAAAGSAVKPFVELPERSGFGGTELDHRPPPQALFPIVQGGIHPMLRRASVSGIMDSGDWPGIAIGGLSVGESKEAMYNTIDVCVPRLPREKPRYLMGVGFPDDLLEAVARGIDLFDCVAPTRMGRHGTVFTPDGKVQVQKSSFRSDRRPLSDECNCPACNNYDRAYLRHLMVAEEPLGPRLLALHNLTFLLDLMAQARKRITEGSFTPWSEQWLSRYRALRGA